MTRHRHKKIPAMVSARPCGQQDETKDAKDNIALPLIIRNIGFQNGIMYDLCRDLGNTFWKVRFGLETPESVRKFIEENPEKVEAAFIDLAMTFERAELTLFFRKGRHG